MTLLEKSRGVGGRAATRRRNGCRYDHGANYVNPDDGGRTADLHVAGDWVAGEARAHAALWNGIEPGEQLGTFIED
ncbi:hypothetical protein JCM17823_27630 [Halorubrum gandharaense]